MDRRFVFAPEDKEQFRIYMRMIEKFSGCRVLAYCLMCNHFHILLEVTPRPKEPLTDAELLKRLRGLYSPAEVTVVAKELAAARELVAQGQTVNGIDVDGVSPRSLTKRLTGAVTENRVRAWRDRFVSNFPGRFIT